MSHQTTAELSIYERIGGENAIMAAAAGLYERVMNHPELAPFFEGLDMTQQVRKQVAFLSWAFGGPERYSYRPLDQAHRHLRAQGLSSRHFDLVAGELAATLRDLKVDEALVQEVLALVESTRSQVLG